MLIYLNYIISEDFLLNDITRVLSFTEQNSACVIFELAQICIYNIDINTGFFQSKCLIFYKPTEQKHPIPLQ
jgi:hypothetical protein